MNSKIRNPTPLAGSRCHAHAPEPPRTAIRRRGHSSAQPLSAVACFPSSAAILHMNVREGAAVAQHREEWAGAGAWRAGPRGSERPRLCATAADRCSCRRRAASAWMRCRLLWMRASCGTTHESTCAAQHMNGSQIRLASSILSLGDPGGGGHFIPGPNQPAQLFKNHPCTVPLSPAPLQNWPKIIRQLLEKMDNLNMGKKCHSFSCLGGSEAIPQVRHAVS